MSGLIAKALASLSLALSQPIQSFCDLDTADGPALVSRKGEYVTFLRIQGLRRMTLREDVERIAEGLRIDLSGSLEGPGHAIQGWYACDPDLAGTEIRRLATSARQTALQLGMDLSFIFAERERLWPRIMRWEACCFVLWSKRSLLTREERKQAAEERKKAANGAPAFGDAQNPFQSSDILAAKHAAFVQRVAGTFRDHEIAVEVLGPRDALAAARAALYPETADSGWQPLLPGDNVMPRLPVDGEHGDVGLLLWPSLRDQLFHADAETHGGQRAQITDGALSEDEAFALADQVCATGIHPGAGDGQDVIEELIDAKLIFELSSVGGEVRIRSRFGEMMRLLAANRQLFPNKPWQGAPSLVADFRLDCRPRRFPGRWRDPAVVLRDHEAQVAPTPLRKALWRALTARPGMQLADFQERAALRLAAATNDGGTIVTAGTGSGKTIAFYLPGMIRIGEAIGPDHWVKALAIYPRVELLKDQFSEAYRMARGIDGALREHGRRPLIIGALFRATPRRADTRDLAERKWQRLGEDFICPWMRCPICNRELVWRAADIAEARERLRCAHRNCGGVVSEDQIVLTRGRLQRQPPDILFTTTEILNQRLSDHWMRGLFGVGLPSAKQPLLALLDEVHTYEGVTGAQAALTLRRWRHLLGSPISWVGLSATLGDAARFFADLTGAHPDRVVEITPAAGEFEEKGAEYQILLRGDPASRASLLSTTIQTSMLVSRLLDPPGAMTASGAFGRRAFLFTDDLDVTNRLFDDLRDAEAYTIFGKPDNQRMPLANIRRGGGDATVRDVEGQRWRVCEDIGHPLDRRLIVGRTTSQDAGVNQAANIVVATAALEVGFNDPLVGAVIQHKAPRGMASFLQRKGRAGRDQAMRPIMLTVLSDYGRDRAFYQAFEHLFDPTLEAQYLPIRNPYVLKIQGVLALFDWLGARTAGSEKAWQWDILSRPLIRPSTQVRAVLERTKAVLTRLIQGDEATIDDLRSYLGDALGIEHALVDSLLWEAPRSLLLEAVPTLFRRVFRNWQLAIPSAANNLDLQIDYHPLPDFIPRTLFSDLALPEVRLIVPQATVNHEERVEGMPILQALNQFAPGRVTRRFAHERGGLSHWVPVDPGRPEQECRISDYALEYEFIGTFTGRLNGRCDDEPLLVFRPWTIQLERAARDDALPSSNARLAWQSDIEPNGDPLSVPVPARSEWRRHVTAIEFHLHRFRSSVSVRRFAGSAHANVRTMQDDFSVISYFTSDDDRPAAIGFELEVDGFRLDLALPSSEMLANGQLPPGLMAASRLAFLRDAFRTDPELPSDLNGFQRDWLFEFLVSALLAEAARAQLSLDAVIADLLDEDHLQGVFHGVSAKHAASDFIRVHRGDLPLLYAQGKGFSSIFRAIEDYLLKPTSA